jgi:hypothetical protein
VRIEDLLREVDSYCHFSREFRPLGGYEARSENIYPTLLAALIAHGTNLGIAAMGQSAQGITVDMLQHVTRWFLREDTLKAANAVLVNFHHELPISTAWGSGVVSSSDGQRFGIQQSSLLASFYPRYFGYYERAISLYTHTSDQYSVFGTRVISCSPREALYVLDGLLENNTVLRLLSITPIPTASRNTSSRSPIYWDIRLCHGSATWQTSNSIGWTGTRAMAVSTRCFGRWWIRTSSGNNGINLSVWLLRSNNARPRRT